MAKSRQIVDTIAQYGGFVTSAESPEAIQSFLSVAPRPPVHARIRQDVIFSRHDLAGILTNASLPRQLRIRLVNSNAPVFRVSVSGAEGQSSLRGDIVVFRSNFPNIFRIATVSFKNFWDRGVKKLVRALYPYAMPIFFKQNEIKDALIRFEHGLDRRFEVGIVDATLKKKRAGKSSRILRFDTERIWTEQTISDVFEQAEERNEWFTSLQFKVDRRLVGADRKETVAYCRVSKQGEIHYDLLHQEISETVS